MKKLLVVIDMQNDFVNGSLGTKEAVGIVSSVCEKINAYRQNGDVVWFTRDTHPEDYLETLEGKHLPVTHCIKNTAGWELHPRIQALVQPEDLIFDKPTFGSVALAEQIKADGFSEVELCGLCTDICVISNCAVVKAFCPEIQIVVDSACVAGVTPETHQSALDVMKMLQTEVQ